MIPVESITIATARPTFAHDRLVLHEWWPEPMRGLRVTIVAGHLPGKTEEQRSPWLAADRELHRWAAFLAHDPPAWYQVEATITWADGLTVLCDVRMWSRDRERGCVQDGALYALSHALAPKTYPVRQHKDEPDDRFAHRLAYTYQGVEPYVALCGASDEEKAAARRILTGHDFGYWRDGAPFRPTLSQDAATP